MTTLWPAGNGVPEPGPSTSGGTRGRVGCLSSRVSTATLPSFLKARSQECDPFFVFKFNLSFPQFPSQSLQLIPLFKLLFFGIFPLILLFLGPFFNSYVLYTLMLGEAVLLFPYFIYILLNSQPPLF